MPDKKAELMGRLTSVKQKRFPRPAPMGATHARATHRWLVWTHATVSEPAAPQQAPVGARDAREPGVIWACDTDESTVLAVSTVF